MTLATFRALIVCAEKSPALNFISGLRPTIPLTKLKKKNFEGIIVLSGTDLSEKIHRVGNFDRAKFANFPWLPLDLCLETGEYSGSNYSLTLMKEDSEHKYAVESDAN